MTEFRDDEYRDVDVQRDENGMIIMPSERKTEPPPKTGGLARIIFVAAIAVAGVGGYLWMQNAPPVQEYTLEQSEAQPYTAPQPRQLAMNETPAPQAPTAPRASSPPADTPMPEPTPQAVPPIAPADPIAPPPLNLNTPPAGE